MSRFGVDVEVKCARGPITGRPSVPLKLATSLALSLFPDPHVWLFKRLSLFSLDLSSSLVGLRGLNHIISSDFIPHQRTGERLLLARISTSLKVLYLTLIWAIRELHRNHSSTGHTNFLSYNLKLILSHLRLDRKRSRAE